MKRIFFAFLMFFSVFIFAQMPNISQVWLNKNEPFFGKIGAENMPMKVYILTSEQDKKNDQEYFVSGYSLVEKVNTKFEGKIKITKYKDGKKKSTIYGEYDFAEAGNGEHSGVLKGKFIYTFNWNSKTQAVEGTYIQFAGNWKNYANTMDYRTQWNNQISK